jgi:hypothetical protein
MAKRSFEELKHKTVAQLREIAAGIEHDAVKGYTQLNKEHLNKSKSNATETKIFSAAPGSGNPLLAFPEGARAVGRDRCH